MKIILIGPPGTGKGTMAQLIEKRFGLKHISAGDLLRDEVKNNTALGQKVAPIMKAGKLVDNSFVAEIIATNVQKFIEIGFILDGFPRNLTQAIILEDIFNKIKIKIELVLLIETKEELIIKRLSERRQCPECNEIYGVNIPPKIRGKCDKDGTTLVIRDDDKPKVIKKRLQLYRKGADPLIKFYKGKNLVIEVNGNNGVEEVFKEISKKLKEKLQ